MWAPDPPSLAMRVATNISTCSFVNGRSPLLFILDEDVLLVELRLENSLAAAADVDVSLDVVVVGLLLLFRN